MPRPLPPNQLESLDQSCIGILVTLWKTSRVNHCPIFLSSSTIFPIHCIFFSQTMFEILCFFSSLYPFHSSSYSTLFPFHLQRLSLWERDGGPASIPVKKTSFQKLFFQQFTELIQHHRRKERFSHLFPHPCKTWIYEKKQSTLRCNHCCKVSSISASDGSEHEGEDQAQAAQTAPEAEIADSPQVFSWK